MLINMPCTSWRSFPKLYLPFFQWFSDDSMILSYQNRRDACHTPLATNSVIKNGGTRMELFSLLWPKITPQEGHRWVMLTIISLAGGWSAKLAINTQLQLTLKRSGDLWCKEDTYCNLHDSSDKLRSLLFIKSYFI